MTSREYRFATVAELGRALRCGLVSAAELAEAAHEALSSIGPGLNAVASLLPERSRAEAERAQRRLRESDAPSPLCGIPYGVKDLYAARGAPTTWGAPSFADRVFETDAAVVRRLSRRGGLLAAKLAMVELAGAGRARIAGASMHGSGRNPWDASRYAGGSSSGSAIPGAAGLLPYTLGTETGGSIVGPAAFCGVTGLRPTHGLVSRDGALVISPTLDKPGPLARTADDCATVLQAIALRPIAVSAEFLPHVRVAFLEEEFDECAPHMRTALARAVAELRQVVPNFVHRGINRELPYGPTLETIMLAESAAALRPWLEQSDFELVDADQLAELRRGLQLPAHLYLEAMQARDEVGRELARAFDSADVMLTVSRTGTAPPLDQHREQRTTRSMSDTLRAAGNLAGVPAISFPCGLADDGLPVGLQLIAPRGADARVLAIVSSYQSRTDHHLRRPPG